MALTPEQLQQAAGNYLAKKTVQKPPTYAQPQEDVNSQIASMPNADKLTNFEKSAYKALPGVTTWMENNKIFGTSVSDQLDKFNNSWAGKALMKLDMLAEGFERGVGLIAQMQDPNFDMKDLRAAWYAGSLTYDTINLPRVVRGGEDIVDPLTGRRGKSVIGFEVPTDLPGAKSGLADAREEIARLIQIGYSPQEALEKARDNYYNGLGALALRGQMQDMWGHVLLDPLNVLTGYLKPIQALKAKRFAALSKIAGGVEDIVTKGDDIYKLAKTADKIEDALAFTDEAYRLAQAAGDTKKAAKLGEELAELAKQAGRTEDAARYLSEGSEFARISGSAEEAAQFTNRALADLGRKQITRGDKIAIFLTGGDPFRPTKLGQTLRKIPGVGFIGKAFELTPAAKAHELLTVVGDNLGANLISRVINNVDAEADFVNAIHRIKKGATGIEYGHALLTQQGKTVQGFLSGADFDLQKTLSTYQKLAPQRQQLQVISEALGESPAKLLKMFDENPQAVMKMLAGKSPVLDEMIATGGLNEDVLKSLRRMFPDDGSVPYNREMFFAASLDAIETAVARQAVVQFGIESKGVLTRWSDALKAAESLAFLRLSPAYPIRNMINNEVTMISRGLFGVIDNNMVDDFWKGFGFTPARLEEMGLSADIAKASFNKAEQVIQDALDGGMPNKAKEFFQNINLGKLDTAAFSQKFEKAAGRKAFTLGAQQYLRKYFKPKPIKQYLNPRLADELDNLDPQLAKQLDNIIRSSGASELKFDELIGKNLNLSVDNIIDDVVAKTGQDAREVLGDEMLEFLHQKLPSAIESGRLDAFKLEARQLMEKHVDGLFQRHLDDLVEHTKSQAVAGGPNVWNAKLAEAQDVFWGAHMEHAMRMPEVTKAAREAAEIGDFKAARALWEQEFLDSKNMYTRAFKRVDAYIQGLEEGTTELAKRGAKLPFTEVRKTFGKWKGMWEEFYTARNKLYDEYFKAAEKAPKGQKPKFDDVRAELSKLFDKNIAKEDEFAQALDDTIASMLPEQVRTPFMTARDQLAELRRADKLEVKKMFDMEFENGTAKQDAWNKFWQARTQRFQDMRAVDSASIMIQQGDEAATQAFASAAKEGEGFDIFKVANEYGVASATASGARNDRRVLATVNKYLPEGTEKFKKIDDIPEDIARQAFEARSAAKGTTPPPKVKPNFIADVNKVIPPMKPIDLAMDQNMYGRVQPMLDNVISGAQEASKKAPTLLKDLPENVQQELLKAFKTVKNDFASTRYQAVKFGEWRRDSALLNYNRRTNFDNWLGHVAPFGFWTTNSMFKWAIESIDRPAMLANYLRVKKFMATNGLQRDGMPSRVKGKFRVQLPFAPEWMGEQFIDPLRMMLPFDNWLSPFDQMQKEQESAEGRAERTLDQLLQDGKITQDDYEEAMENRSGATWEYALSVAQQNQDGDRYDAWDFATALQAPHAPLMWAYNAAFGDKEDIPSFSPLSRLARNTATILGVEDWNNSKWNLEAKLRRSMGLNSFDKWDDYRIDRSIANLAGDGSFTPDEVKEAMAISALVQQGKMTPEQAKQQSEAYREGVKRSNQEFTGGVGGYIGSILGLSVTSVPQGETNLRALQDDFAKAYQSYKKADDSMDAFLAANPDLDPEDAMELWEKKNPQLAKDADALRNFFDENPEYENRLAIFDKPEERMQKFMIDQMWQKYNELPTINKEEVREQLGEDFQQTFLNKETRSYDDIPTEVMAVWLKMMNVDPLGGLTADQRLLVSLYGKVKMTDPEMAWRVETFYDQRNGQFDNWRELQEEYYNLPKNKRKQFVKQNPELRQYFDWRSSFMRDNPDLVPYITDNEKAIEKAKNQTRTQQAVPTAQELQVQIPDSLQNIIRLSDGKLPASAERELERIAEQNGMSVETLMGILGVP